MFEKIIVDKVNSFSGEVSVYLRRLDCEEPIFVYNGDRVVPSASTIKVIIMAELMRQAEEGAFKLTDMLPIPPQEKLQDSVIGVLEITEMSIQDLNTMMIILSDNTATNLMIDLVGMDSVNRLAGELGLTGTELARKMLDWEAMKAGRQNYTTANDLAKLYDMIAKKQLVGSELMLKTLFNQKHTQRLKRYLPEEVKMATKPGSIDRVELDFGIIYKEETPWIWGVLVTDAPNLEASEFISTLTREVYSLL